MHFSKTCNNFHRFLDFASTRTTHRKLVLHLAEMRLYFYIIFLGKKIPGRQGESKSLPFSAVLVYLNYVRLQNSPYFCVFKYARVVKQKVWNEAENRERDWRETLKIRTVRFAYVIFVRITRFSQPRAIPIG